MRMEAKMRIRKRRAEELNGMKRIETRQKRIKERNEGVKEQRKGS